jgi:hypothetical protein
MVQSRKISQSVGPGPLQLLGVVRLRVVRLGVVRLRVVRLGVVRLEVMRLLLVVLLGVGPLQLTQQGLAWRVPLAASLPQICNRGHDE